MNHPCALRKVLVFFITLIAVPPALAKGPPDKVTVSGPELAEEVEVIGQQHLDDLAMGVLTDFRRGRIIPPDVGVGYELVRYFGAEGGTFRAFDRLHYYPRPSGRGYVFYAGIEGGFSEYDGRWFYATARGESALRQVLGRDISDLTALPASSRLRQRSIAI